MFRSIMAALSALTLLASWAQAQGIEIEDFSGNETVITFDPGFPCQTEPYVHMGVTFDENGGGSGGPGFCATVNWGGFFDNIPGASLGTGFHDLWGDSLIIIKLPPGQRRAGALFSTSPTTTWTMTAFDDNNNVLGSVERSMPGDSEAVFIGLEVDANISRLEVDETNGENGHISLMDDLRFEPVGGGCGERAKLSAKCKQGGTYVIGSLKRATPDTEVTFTLDGGQDIQAVTNNRGKSKAKWRDQAPGGHTVRVCDLEDAC